MGGIVSRNTAKAGRRIARIYTAKAGGRIASRLVRVLGGEVNAVFGRRLFLFQPFERVGRLVSIKSPVLMCYHKVLIDL